MFNAQAGHRINVLAVGADAWPLMPFRAVVYVNGRTVLGSQCLNNQVVHFLFCVCLSDDLFHSPIPPLHPHRTPCIHSILRNGGSCCKSPPPPLGILGTSLLVSFLEAPELAFLLRVDDVDCLHRETRESVRAADGAAECAWVTRIHPAIADFRPCPFADVCSTAAVPATGK